MIETDYHILQGGGYGDKLPYTVIYSLVNLDNGKRYIGRTQNPKHRISIHMAAIKGKYHQNRLIREDSGCRFGFEILEEGVSFIDRTDKEREYIIKYKTYDERYGYNGNDPCVKNHRGYTKRMQSLCQELMSTR